MGFQNTDPGFIYDLIQSLITQNITNITGTTITLGTTTLNEDKLKLFSMDSSTGAYSFSGITIGTGNTFNVGQAKGYIVNSNDPLNVTSTFVNYAGATGLTTPYLSSSTATYIMLNSGNTLTYSPTEPTVTQRRQNIYLGVLGHPNNTLGGVGNRADLLVNTMSQFRDMVKPMKFINDGIRCFANSTNMTLANTSGTLYGLGIGYMANGFDNPTSITIASGSPTTFQYRTQTGKTFTNTTTISAGTYDVGGVDTVIPTGSTRASNQRIYVLENGNIRIQFGQTLYYTLTEAVAGASSETFVPAENNKNLGVLIGILSLTRDCTNLADPSKAMFLQVNKFGETVGSSAGQAGGYLLASLTSSANVDQTLTTTASVINFDTDDNMEYGGIDRSGSTFVIYSSGLYQFTLQPQILQNTNSNTVTIWGQKNGVNIPRTGIKSTSSGAGDAMVLPLIITLDLVANDQIQFQGITTAVNGATLDFTASGATVPAIPAVIIDVKGWKK